VGQRFHLVLHIFVMIVLIGVDLVSHWQLRGRYLKRVTPIMRDAVRQYQLAEDPEEHVYVLTMGGTRVTSLGEEAGDLGLGKFPSVRGFLQEARSRIDEANAGLASDIRKVLARFTKYGAGRPEEHVARASLFDPKVEPKWFHRVSFTQPGGPSSVPRNLEGKRILDGVIGDGECIDLRTRVPVAPVPGLPDSMRKTVRDALAKVRMGVRTDPRVAKRVVAGYEKEMALSQEPLTKFFASAAKHRGKRGSKDPCADWTTCFHERLVDLLKGEVGYFWLFGNWRWIEIFLLTCLGVMVEAMVRFGIHIVGRAKPEGEIWDPNETWRTGLKLLYAPITSMIAIWTLITTDVIDIGLANTAGGTLLVTLAFLFGLFPNLAVSIFKRLAEAIFQRTSVAAPPKKGRTKVTKVSSAPSVTPGQPPDFEEFKKALARHVTAPLKQ
jgi:hypothetical protein